MSYWQSKIAAQQDTHAETAPGFLKDIHKQDRLLGELNIFDELQKEIFYKLCTLWQPELDMKKTLDKISCSHPGNKETACLQLLEKLERGHYGKLVTIYKEDPEAPEKALLAHKIVITERDSYNFLEAYIRDLFSQQYAHAGSTAFPIKAALEKQKENPLIFPNERCLPVPLEKFSPELIKQYQDQPIFILLNIQSNTLICPSGLLPELVKVSQMVISKTLSDINNDKYQKMVEIIAKANNLTFTAFRQALLLQNPDWKTISQQINTYLQFCKQNKQALPALHPSLWQAMAIIYYYANNQASEETKKQQRLAQQKTDIRNIIEIVRQSNHILTYTELDKLLTSKQKNYGEHYADFTKEFYDHHTTKGTDQNSLESKTVFSDKVILILDTEHIIHKDNLAKYVGKLLEKLHPELQAELIREMRIFIKHPQDQHAFLNSYKLYTEKLRTLTIEKQPLLHIILTKHLDDFFASAEQHDKTSAVRKLVEKYFVLNKDMKYVLRPLDELLEVALIDIFEQAILELIPGFLLKLYKKMSGRYLSLYEKFLKLSPGTSKLLERMAKELPQKEKPRSPEPASKSRRSSPGPRTTNKITTAPKVPKLDEKKVMSDFTELIKKSK